MAGDAGEGAAAARITVGAATVVLLAGSGAVRGAVGREGTPDTAERDTGNGVIGEKGTIGAAADIEAAEPIGATKGLVTAGVGETTAVVGGAT